MIKKKMLFVIMCLLIGFFVVNVFVVFLESIVQELYENVKVEGEVIWQVFGVIVMWKFMVDVFEVKYLGIKVLFFSVCGSQMFVCIIIEFRVNKFIVDVVICFGVDEIVFFIERDFFFKYDWFKIFDVNFGDVYFDGCFIFYYDSFMIWVYNL